MGQEEEVINRGKGKLPLALHQDSHTDQRQKMAGTESVQVERQGGQKGPQGQHASARLVSMWEDQGHRDWQDKLWIERV